MKAVLCFSIQSEIQEIAADMDEFKRLSELLNSSGQEKLAKLDQIVAERFARRAADNWKKIQCLCDCKDAERWIIHTVQMMSSNWPEWLTMHYHIGIQNKVPTWPIKPAGF